MNFAWDGMFPKFNKKRKTKIKVTEEETTKSPTPQHSEAMMVEQLASVDLVQQPKRCGPVVKPKEIMTFIPSPDASCPRFCKVMPEFAHHLSIFLKDFYTELLARNGSRKNDETPGQTAVPPIVVEEISSFGPLASEANKFEILMDANFHNFFVTPLIVFFQDLLKLSMIRSGVVSADESQTVEALEDSLLKQRESLQLGVEYHHQAIQFLCNNIELCKQAITCWAEYIKGVIRIISAIVRNDYAQKMVEFAREAKELGHQLDRLEFGNREDVGLYIDFDISNVLTPKQAFDTQSGEIEFVGPSSGKFSRKPASHKSGEISLEKEPIQHSTQPREDIIPIGSRYGGSDTQIEAKFRPLGPNDYARIDQEDGSESDQLGNPGSESSSGSDSGSGSDSESSSDGGSIHRNANHGLCSMDPAGFSLGISSAGVEHHVVNKEKTVQTTFDKSYYDTESGRMMHVYSLKKKHVTLTKDKYRLRLVFSQNGGKSVVVHINIPKDRVSRCQHGFELRAQNITHSGLLCPDCGQKLVTDLRFLFSGRNLDKIVFGVAGQCEPVQYV